MNIPTKPQDVTWTDDQWKAIHASGKDILVAAAAGSGKTAVLVERIIEKITSETNPINVDELLVATFTNASAAEMRQRIGDALEKEIAKNPYSNHLRRQLSLLNHASISTLHSFCLDVVRKYYYLIDIDPGFRLMEETEGMLLQDEALESLLEEEYGKQDNERFFKVVDMFTNDRNDDELQNLILQLFEFSRANPNPDRWLESLVDIYDLKENQTVEDLPFIEPLLYDLELQLNEAKRLFEEALELTRQPGGPDKRAENFEADIALVNELLRAKNDSFQALYDAFQGISFSRLKTCRGDEYIGELVDKSKDLREQGKKIITSIKEDLFSRKPDTYLNDLREMKEPIATLVELVRGFSQKFNELKKEKGLVDFSDLEHYALQILGTPDEKTGDFIPTEAALSYQRQFKEVFIDEYQDTNMVQESILQLVKKPSEAEGNLFMVGDVKQSIYRFRLAEPKLFLEKYLRFKLDGKNSGLRIDLSKNFRSRKEVLDGTNFIFKQVMGKVVGEIEYDEAAELKLGADYPQDKPYPVEFTIIHKEDAEDNQTNGQDFSSEDVEEDFFTKEELEQSELESLYVARKIRELIDSEVEVYDTKKKTYRPIQYKDIVILFRSFKWAPQFMEACKDENIPVYADISTGYFEAAEVATMLSLLQVIDNPYQDIPLVSVLRSPIIGLNEEELAKIRVHAKRTTFYDAVKQFQQLQPQSELEEKIQRKLDLFLQRLNDWRTLARSGSLSDLIWQLYRDTKFYDYVGGLPGGKQRQANLRALYDRARQYESTSFRGLFRFLRFIERMQDRGEDLGVARALGENEDVVRIITIHKSKGLEFPVVFVAGMGREFNMMDLRKNYLFDKEFGLATNYINPEKQITYPSLIHMSFVRKKRLELIAEEMRVLYVALTRAKEKLYLVGSTKKKEKLMDKWQKHLSEKEWLLSDFDRMKAKSYLDWVGPALIRHRDAGNLRLTEIDPTDDTVLEVFEHPSIWKVDWVSSLSLNKSDDESQEDENLLNYVRKGEPVPVESEYKEKIASQLQWKYEFAPATVHRSKQSVTEIKRLREIKDEYSDIRLIRPFKKPITARPKFMQEKKLTPAEKGTAMHMVMQHVDLSTKPTKESIEKQIFLMQERELMTEEEAKAIDIDAVVHFFDTEIGLRVLGSDWVRREVPFSFTLPPEEVYPDWQEGDDPVFVQGMIDLLIKDANGLVLIDYKTDQITERFKGGFEEAKPVLLKRYKTQVELYRKAIETIFGEPVTASYLYFFDGGHVLPVD